MSQRGSRRQKEIDYVFARYPLWVRYSGLPEKIGIVAWAVYQRLLELRCRFESTKFFYPNEKLCQTTGVSGIGAMRRVLKRLEEDGLLRYKTQRGRGQATEFEIIEPINTPTPEEEIYKTHPRLRSKSYNRRIREESEKEESDPRDQFSENADKSDPRDQFSENKSDPKDQFLEEESDPRDQFLEDKSDPGDHPLKRSCIKRQQQQNDLFISGTPDDPQDVPKPAEPDSDNAVVAPNTQNLKEYGISGELAERYTRIYAPHYIEDKIEIIEYKRFKGEQIRNPGGMLKKAIEEDWQRPEGFSTRAQREEAARAAKEAEKAEKLKEKERLENIRREEETAAAAEEWRKAAAPEILARIRERAVNEVKARFPDTDESLLRVPIRLEENKIIAKEFLSPDSS